VTGFKPCPSGHKNDKIALAAGHAVFNGRVSQCKTPIGAVGDDPSTHQEVVKRSQTGNPRRFSVGRMSKYDTASRSNIHRTARQSSTAPKPDFSPRIVCHRAQPLSDCRMPHCLSRRRKLSGLSGIGKPRHSRRSTPWGMGDADRIEPPCRRHPLASSDKPISSLAIL